MHQFACSCCLELLTTNSDIATTPCGHVFHFECISRWLTDNENCAQCRNSCDVQTLIKLFMTESQAAIEEQMRIDDINEERLNMEEKIQISDREVATLKKSIMVELVSKELNHLAAILHVYAEGLNFMK